MTPRDHRPGPFAVRRDGEPVPTALAGAVAAIGNFDGVHRGHQALLAAVRAEAERLGRPAAALTFEPHPRAFFAPDRSMFRLTPEPVKLALLARFGLDGAFVLRFDGALAATSAAGFAERLAELSLGGVVIGHDFHFGRGREGTPAILSDLCAQRGLACRIVPAVTVREGDAPVSSTAIRTALSLGEVAHANALLGYRWQVRERVRHGEKRGRTLGYPTANMALDPGLGLRHGIYAVRARVGEAIRDGVASFGRRPTFDDGAPLLETFLFDFAGDLYGQEVAVEFVGWIRGEERFASAEALVARMDEDSRAARAMLGHDGGPPSLL
jgi:riboflavin kinase / FMN adenylyltransferase